jgi:hypothetical protein
MDERRSTLKVREISADDSERRKVLRGFNYQNYSWMR